MDYCIGKIWDCTDIGSVNIKETGGARLYAAYQINGEWFGNNSIEPTKDYSVRSL